MNEQVAWAVAFLCSIALTVIITTVACDVVSNQAHCDVGLRAADDGRYFDRDGNEWRQVR
jgi:hypothetical protein